MIDSHPQQLKEETGPTQANRRATVRYRCAPPNTGRAFLANSTRSDDALVLDVSLGGIGFILNTYVEPGTLLRVEMGAAGMDAWTDLAATVAHVSLLEPGRWRYGCEWLRALTEDELQMLRHPD